MKHVLKHKLAILKQAEAGVPVPELCREHGMSSATFYKWRSRYGGMNVAMLSEMKAMVEENRRNVVMKVLTKSWPIMAVG